MGALSQAASLVIKIIVELYVFVLMLRFVLQKIGASWYNPFCQFVIKVTEPVIKPLKRFIPGFKGFDLSIIALALILQMILLWVLIWLGYHTLPGIVGTVVIALGQLGKKLVNIFFYAVIINAIISWFPTLRANPAAELVNLIAEPALRPARRFVPMIGGFDLSPIVVFVVLLLINSLVMNNIINLGLRLAF